MKNNKTLAFTLVELIVVITILAVLATVAFISFQGYTSSSRDSVRLADLKNISKSFEINRTKGIDFPLPDKKIDISSSGTIFQYQGELSQEILNSDLNIFDGGVDPLSGDNYGYAVNSARNKFQIIGFLENQDSLANISMNTSFADNSDKYVKSSGDSLGILLDSDTNEVIIQNGSLVEIDVQTNTQTYTFVESNNTISHPSILALKGMFNERYNPIASCKSILLHGNSQGNGLYTINPTGISGEDFQVYCDMNTDGGGWTIIAGNGQKFGWSLPLNTTNPNLENYNMSGEQLEKMIVNQGWKEYQYKIGYNQEDITVNFGINIDSEKLSLAEGETPLCFADKSIKYSSDSQDFLNPELAAYSWATYNNGKLLYPKRKNDILRVKMYCENENYGFNHIKTIIGEHDAQHLSSDSYEFDGSKRNFSQFYISVNYLDSKVNVNNLPTFNGNLKWEERGEEGSWHHYYLTNPSADFSDGLDVPEISYNAENWEGESNIYFDSYMMMR